MKVFIAQVNPTVGDLRGNFSMMKQKIQFAVQYEADVIVFPELVTVGYPPKDLLYNNSIWENHDVLVKQMQSFINSLGKQITVIFGGLHQVEQTYGRYSRYNAAFIIDPYHKTRVVHKRLLPCYDVFDETRYFTSGIDEPYLPIPIRISRPTGDYDVKTDVIICEDMWNFGHIGNVSWMAPASYTHDPISHLKGDGPLFIINGSPFWQGKIERTKNLVRDISQHIDRPVFWVNQVGGQDDVVFGGYSMFVSPSGIGFTEEYVCGGELGRVKSRTSLFTCHSFAEDFCVVDLMKSEVVTPESINPNPAYNNKVIDKEDLDTWYIYSALRLGLYDYCRRNNFKEIVFGASGGIDSAVVGAIAAEAVGGSNVTAITMPSKFSSEGSVSDAKELADNYGMTFLQWPIGDIHTDIRGRLLSGGKQKFSSAVVDQNIQPRIRGTLLMGYSNDTGALLVSTGNKSESAVGYCTIYGDTCGGYALLIDVLKTHVYEIARFINKYRGNMIPMNSIEKPPSAELAEGQKDTDNLPPYDVLDPMLVDIVEKELPIDQVKLRTKMPERVAEIMRKIEISEWKRGQVAIGPKISERAFGNGRRIPISKNVRFV